MKGLILAGGKGSRLRPFTYSGAKQLVPIANAPVVTFPIRQLVEAGISDIGIVVGDTGAQVRQALGDGSAFGAHFTYIDQPQPLGIAHGIVVAREFLGAEPFVMYLGDNVLKGGISEFVRTFTASDAAGSVILKEVDDPRAFGVAEVHGERLLRVVEKPANPATNLAVIGIYAFRSPVFDCIGRQQPSSRNELEIADTINGLLEAGHEVRFTVTLEYWIDTGKMEDMLNANRVLLETLDHAVDPGARIEGSSVQGEVTIGPGSIVAGSTILGPVNIGAGVQLRGCRIGPHVAIGDGSRLLSVTIADSIVMEQSSIEDCPGITASMIGRFTRVCGAPEGAMLTLGDHSCLEVRR